MSISFIVPTIGRPSLLKTLQSIELYENDEILLVGARAFVKPMPPQLKFIECPPGGDWGHSERNFATQFAKGDYVAHLDDDDRYANGHRRMMELAMAEAGHTRPILFRMRFPNGITLWREQKLYCGNLGTPTFLLPNDQKRFAGSSWQPFVGGDFAFLAGCGWKEDDFVWRPEIIALIGRDPH